MNSIFPFINDLNNYLISIKGIAEHPVSPIAGPQLEGAVIQSDQMAIRYSLTFAFPNDEAHIQKYVLPLVCLFRISPIVNIFSPDLALLTRDEDNARTVVAGLEELSINVAENQSEILTLVLQVIPLSSKLIGKELQYRHATEPDSVRGVLDSQTLLAKVVHAKVKNVSGRFGLYNEETAAVIKSTDPLFPNAGHSFRLTGITSRAASIKNILSIHPVAGSRLPMLQYYAYGGALLTLGLHASLDTGLPAIKELIEHVNSFREKRSLMQSGESLELTDALADIVCAFDYEKTFACLRINGATTPNTSGYYSYQISFAHVDNRWYNRSSYVARQHGISREQFKEKLTEIIAGAYSSIASAKNSAQSYIPFTSTELKEFGQLTTFFPLNALNTDQVLTSGGYESVINPDSLLATFATMVGRETLEADTEVSYATTRWFSSSILFEKAQEVAHQFFEGETIDLPEIIENAFTGFRYGAYTRAIKFLLSHKPKDAFIEALTTTLLERLPPDFRIRDNSRWSITGLINAFNLVYSQIPNEEATIEDDLYPHLPLPTFGDLFADTNDEYLRRFLGEATEFGIITNKKPEEISRLKVPPYIFFHWKGSGGLSQRIGFEEKDYSEKALGLTLNVNLKVSSELVSDTRKLVNERDSGRVSKIAKTLSDYIMEQASYKVMNKAVLFNALRGQLANQASKGNVDGKTTETLAKEMQQSIQNGEENVYITLNYENNLGIQTEQLGPALGAAVVGHLMKRMRVFDDPSRPAAEWLTSIGDVRSPNWAWNTAEFCKEYFQKSKEQAGLDLFQSPVRLFPVMRAYVVTRIGNKTVKRYDYIALRTVLSMQITTDKDDAGIAVVSLLDPLAVLAGNESLDKVLSKKSVGRGDKKEYYSIDVNSYLEHAYGGGGSLIGKLLVIKAGFGGHFHLLDTIFTGQITDAMPGDAFQIVAQDWKYELYNKYVEFYTQKDVDLNIQSHVVRLIQKADPKGIGDVIGAAEFNIYKEVNPAIRASRSVAKSRANQATAYGFNKARNLDIGELLMELLGNPTDYGIYGTDTRLKNIWVPHRNIQKFGRTIDDVRETIWGANPDLSTDSWIVPLQPLWDSLKEAARHTWNHVVDIRPYDAEATLYFGKVDGIYNYTDDTTGPPVSQKSIDALIDPIKNKFVNLRDEIKRIDYPKHPRKSMWDRWGSQGGVSFGEMREENARLLTFYPEAMPAYRELMSLDSGALGLTFGAAFFNKPNEIDYSVYLLIGDAIIDFCSNMDRIDKLSLPEAQKEVQKKSAAEDLKQDIDQAIAGNKSQIRAVYDLAKRDWWEARNELTLLEADFRIKNDTARMIELKQIMAKAQSRLDEIKQQESIYDGLDGDMILKTLRHIAADNGLIREFQQEIGKTQETGKVLFDSFSSKKTLKPFRKYLYASSNSNIINNQIEATEREMANTILINYPMDNTPETMSTFLGVNTKNRLDENIRLGANEAWTYWPLPATSVYEGQGLSWNPGGLANTQLLRVANELNVRTPDVAAKLAITNLAESMRPMYRGTLLLGGHYVNTWDVVFLHDDYNEMSGPVEVQRVVHHYGPDTGWVSDITPHLLTVSNPGSTAVQIGKWDRRMAGIEEVLSRAFDILMLSTLLSGGGAGILLQGGKAVLKKAAELSAKNMLKVPGSLISTALKRDAWKGLFAAAKTLVKQTAIPATRVAAQYVFKELGIEAVGEIGQGIYTIGFADEYRKRALPVMACPLVKDGSPYVAGLGSDIIMFSTFLDGVFYNLRSLIDNFNAGADALIGQNFISIKREAK